MKKTFNKALIFIGPIIFLCIWYLLPQIGLIKKMFLPSPFLVFKEVYFLFIEQNVFIDIWFTLRRTILGFSLAALWGIPIGLIVGYYRRVYYSLEFMIDFFRSLPATALIPLALIIISNSEFARITVVLFACGLIILLNTAYGVKNRSITRIQVATIAGATEFQKFNTVILREALPDIIAGLRISLSLSLVLVIVSEMFIGTRVGLGQKMYDEQLMNHIPNTYAFVIITGILGYLINKIFLLFETKILHWRN